MKQKLFQWICNIMDGEVSERESERTSVEFDEKPDLLSIVLQFLWNEEKQNEMRKIFK